MAIAGNPYTLIAVTMGDPGGIGPEIILKSAAAMARRRRAPDLVVIGDLTTMSETASRLGSSAPVPYAWNFGAAIDRRDNRIPVASSSNLSRKARRPGRITPEGGRASFQYVKLGAELAIAGEVDALVTAPISKEGWDRAGHDYPGHSEFLAEISRAREWRMMFAGDELKLALVTVHMPLKEVSAKLTRTRVLRTITLLNQHLRAAGVARPRIGVLGFNPHAGERGLFGDEEVRAINPAINAAQRAGIDAFGPLAPDTAFIRLRGKFKFDAVVAMYHDQGLIPLKTLEFDRAVNVTLGLPFIRTSPDHGIALDIAGTGRANPSSMLAAIDYAWRAAISRGGRRAAA